MGRTRRHGWKASRGCPGTLRCACEAALTLPRLCGDRSIFSTPTIFSLRVKLYTPDPFATIRWVARRVVRRVRPGVGCNRQDELLHGEFHQGYAVQCRVRDTDRVERNINTARLVDYGAQMPVRPVVHRERRVNGQSGGSDVLAAVHVGGPFFAQLSSTDGRITLCYDYLSIPGGH
jgi:hypothetical protein